MSSEKKMDPVTARILLALIVGAVAPILDSTIVAIGMRTLVDQLHTTVGTLQWITTGYLLALAVAIPFVGWAQARFGGKRLWMFALGLFLFGSVLCAFAWSPESLVAARIVQGLGGGILFPLLQTLAMQASGGQTAGMGKTMALVSLPIAVGPILGPILGGLILNWLDWRWLFLINLPIGVAALILAWRFVPRDKKDENTPSPRLDIVGALLSAPALAGLLLGLSNVHGEGGFGRTDVLVPLIGGALLLTAFVIVALKRREGALINLRLLGHGSVRSASLALILLGGSTFSAMLLLPLYWQSLRGYDVLGAALLLIPQGVGSLLARTVAGRLTDQFGPRWVAAGGFLVVALTTVPFAAADAHTSLWLLGAVLFLRGLGLGGVLIPVMLASFIDLPKHDIPHTSMITRIMQQVGGSFGTALVAVVLQAGLSTGSPESAFSQAFGWVIAMTAAAALCSLLLPRVSKKPAA